MLVICISHLYPITLLRLIVGRGQVQVYLIIIREWAKNTPLPILKNLDNSPPGAFYSTSTPSFLQLGREWERSDKMNSLPSNQIVEDFLINSHPPPPPIFFISTGLHSKHVRFVLSAKFHKSRNKFQCWDQICPNI